MDQPSPIAVGDTLFVADRARTVTAITQAYNSAFAGYDATITVSGVVITIRSSTIILSLKPQGLTQPKQYVYSGKENIHIYD